MRGTIFVVYASAVMLGLLVGLVGSIFQRSIQGLDHLLAKGITYFTTHGWLWAAAFSIVMSMLMVSLAWYLVEHYSKEAAGSGVQQIEGALLTDDESIFWRFLLPVKFIGGLLVIAAKMVVGREGPTIQIGGNLGAMLADGFRFSKKRRHTMIAAGAASGLAVAFNAPLAGALFILEEMHGQFNFTFTNYQSVIISCAVATIVLHVIVGPQAVIPMTTLQYNDLQTIWVFLLFGFITGGIGLLFNTTLLRSVNMVDELKYRTRLIYVLLVSGVVGFLAFAYPHIVGGGYNIIEQSLTLRPTFVLIIGLMVARFCSTMMSYSTGIPGGIFAPLLALGTLLGLAMSKVFGFAFPSVNIDPTMLAVAGMGALFSAAVRAPVTGIVLVVEMTQNYGLILPLMISCLSAAMVMEWVGNPPIYTQLLERTLSKREMNMLHHKRPKT